MDPLAANPTPAPHAAASPEDAPETVNPYYPRARIPRWLLVSFCLLVLAIVAGLGFYLQYRIDDTSQAVASELRSVAELKITPLTAWQRERRGDATVVASLPGLGDALAHWPPSPAAPPSRLSEIDRYMATAQQAYAYEEIHLLDRSLHSVRSYPDGRIWDGQLSPRNRTAILGNNAPDQPSAILLESFHFDRGNRVFMHLLAPLRTTAGELAGAVLLSISADSSIFPILQSWPVATNTAETMLIGREGDELVALSPLRFKADAPLRLRLPFSSPDLLAANALRDGKGTLVRGTDYRGAKVVGLALPVPDSPWVIVAKIDQHEAFGHVWQEIGQLSFAVVILLLAGGLFGRNWLQYRQTEHISKWLETEHRRRLAAERLAVVMRHAHDAILIFDESLRIIDANERAQQLYGYPRPELLRLKAGDLRTPEARSDVGQHFAKALAAEGVTFETTHLRKDGRSFPVEVRSRPVKVNGQLQVISVIRDISQRKMHEREIERLNGLYQVISEVNKVLVRTRSREELFGQICEILVQHGGFCIAWVGWLNPATQAIEPVAVAGDTTGYTTGIRVSADLANPHGRGPSGTALRENRVYVCNDFFADANTGPWQERAAKAGFHATIALPLQEEGKTHGLLTVYANEKNFFQSREIELLRETADDISFALGIFAGEQRRRAAEEALRTREQIFSSIVGQAADAIVLVEVATGRFLEFNRAAHEGLGYTREEFGSFGIADIQADHSSVEIRDNIGRIVATGGISFESRHRHHNGSLRNVRVSAKLLQLSGRDCIAAVWNDITEAKRAEAELRKLSLAVEQSPATIVITDLDGNIEYVNHRFTELTGFTAAEVLGQNPRILKSGLTAAEVYTDLWRTITAGRVWRGEIINRKKNGEVFTEFCIITPVTNAEGQPTHFVALKEDITERLKQEGKVRRLSHIIEQAPLSIAITDLDGTIQYVNPTFLAVTGYGLDDVLGKNPRVLKSGLTPPEVYTEMWQALTRGEVWRGELSNKKKSGEVYYESAVIAPIANEAGQVTHYVALKEDITARKQAEMMLQQVQARYRLMAENTSDVIWLYDLEQEKFAYASPSVYKLLGRTPDEIAMLRITDLLPPGETTITTRELSDRVARYAAGDESARSETREIGHLHRDGRVIPTEVASTLLADASGRPVQMLGITRDITERKRNEAALRESELRFRELFNLESDAIVVYEVETGQITMANEAASENYGYPIARLLEMRTDELSADPEATIATRRQLPDSEGKVAYVPLRRHRRADGSVFPVEISQRVFRRHGKFFAVAVLRDVTLQQQAREQLERFNVELEQKVALRTEELATRTRQVQALLDAIPDTIMRVRTDGAVLDSQPARQGAPELAAITPLKGRAAEPGPSTELLVAALALGKQALHQGVTVMGELEIPHPAGKLFIELRTASTGVDEFVVFARDITARKRLEHESAAMLERERQISEMKTRFISTTSHEFRTPMTAAMVSADLLANHLDRLTPAKRQELFGRIGKSLHRMTEMLDDVLLLNRMDAQRIDVILVAADLRQSLQTCIEEIRLGDRDAHAFDFQATGDLAGFATDPNLLHHIVSNLVSNAVRYSPAGSTVTVHAAGTTAGATLIVSDQGIGIPALDMARIFEPFERGSNVGNIKGTGLGLNIVKRMTEMLHGTIAVEPNTPAGCRFTLFLPRQPLPPPSP